MYLWRKKRKLCVHILDPTTGRSWCNSENNGTSFQMSGEEKPTGRRVCNICQQKMANEAKEKNEKSLLSPSHKQHYRGKQNNFYNSREWHKLRYTAFLKYGRKCLVCGADHKKGARLHVDHIKPISKYPDLAFSLDNLQILCALCNSGKGSWDETDWREEQGNQAMDILEQEMNSHMQEIING